MLALCLFLKVRVSMAVLLSTGPLHPPPPPPAATSYLHPPGCPGIIWVVGTPCPARASTLLA